jgi:hypothetical protein
VPDAEVTLTVGRRSYDIVIHEGPPASVNGGELLLVHPAHFDALVRACVRGGVQPYYDKVWHPGCN